MMSSKRLLKERMRQRSRRNQQTNTERIEENLNITRHMQIYNESRKRSRVITEQRVTISQHIETENATERRMMTRSRTKIAINQEQTISNQHSEAQIATEQVINQHSETQIANEQEVNQHSETQIANEQEVNQHTEEQISTENRNWNTNQQQRLLKWKACQRYRVQPQLHSLGSMSKICHYCQAISFNEETNTFLCCRIGKISLTPYREPDEFLKELFTNNHQYSKNFLTHIRHYNTALAFASLGANIQYPIGGGPYVFKVQGSVYHNQSSVFPQGSDRKSFAQLYILDPDAATEERMLYKGRDSCIRELMLQLSRYIAQVSPFAQAYRTMADILQQSEQTQQQPPVSFVLCNPEENDPRRYNLPSNSHIAVVFQTADGELREPRDIAVYSHRHGPERIPETSPLIDGLLYPLFFPHGDLGWTHSIKNINNQKNISIRDFYAYRLAIRTQSQFNPLHYGRNLFQQFLVDVYCRIEHNRLLFLRTHQRQLRVELYQGLMDYVHNQAPDNVPVGRIVILPSTFNGSPRNMVQKFQDALALVSRFGCPDLFITITCNPHWHEIKNSLLPGQRAQDRPDIVCRVFALKIKALMNEIVDNSIFGKVTGYTYTIEFQKRGLPHMHLLLILDNNNGITTNPEYIDSIVSAEIPDEQEFPELHNLVLQHMVHGPCGVFNPNSPCMVKDRSTGKQICKKKFPKQFSESTILITNTYPLYMRRNIASSAVIRHKQIHNGWIVPYNPYLLYKYQAHINVEICSTITVVKYIYKYFFKGHDRAILGIHQEGHQQTVGYNYDEIQKYIDTRYVAAPEAAWRIQGHKMAGSSHSVFRLAVHLPDHHLVYFTAGKEEQALQNNSQTTLTAWFELNTVDEEARQFYYIEIPLHYVYDLNEKKWKKRQRIRKVIGRIPILNVNQGEKWYLRLLLLHVKGALSFNHIKTYNNQQYSTFEAAARARGLLTDDNEWHAAMREASHCQMPRQMRRLFSTILVFGGPCNPLALWEEFKHDMSHGLTPANQAHDICLTLLNKLLEQLGKNLINFGLPLPQSIAEQSEQIGIDQEKNYNAEELLQKLNPSQRDVAKSVLAAIEADNGENFFLDGPGGTGKTFLYNILIQLLKLQNRNVIAVASTGIAATLLQGGTTAHSAFKVPIPCNRDSVCNMMMTSEQADRIRRACIVIWDEAPMTHKDVLHAVDRLLQDIQQSNRAFGGKVMLLGGDFRQILPIAEISNPIASIAALISKSELWNAFKLFHLRQNMRTNIEEIDFSNWLLNVGNASANIQNSQNDICLQDLKKVSSTTKLIEAVFGTDFATQEQQFSDRVILCAYHEQTRKINDIIVDKLKGEMHVYISSDMQVTDQDHESTLYPTEFLNHLNPSGMPSHKLKLKKGCIVMLLRNLSVADGLCNGTRLEINNLGKNIIIATILSGSKAGEIVFIPRITFQISADHNIPCNFTRRQFPLQLSYSMTINKSQGQTFSKVGIHLLQSVFTHGQLYVALSRCRSASSLVIYLPTDANGITKNHVYHSALLQS